MKKTVLKFAAGFLALVAGIVIVWASGIFQVLFSASVSLSAPVAETATTQQPVRDKSGKVLIQPKEFEYGKGWVANVEIINETAQAIFYIGSNRKYKFDYCTLAAKRKEQNENLSVRVRDVCYYGTFLTLQTLAPGGSIVLAVNEHEVRDMLYIRDAKLETKAQIGFELFVGEDKHREILWSEEIAFPYDDHR